MAIRLGGDKIEKLKPPISLFSVFFPTSTTHAHDVPCLGAAFGVDYDFSHWHYSSLLFPHQLGEMNTPADTSMACQSQSSNSLEGEKTVRRD